MKLQITVVPFLQAGSRKHRSSEPVPRTHTDRTLTEQERNAYRTDTERERNGYRTGTEHIENGYGTDTERERERVQNGNRTRSVKRSLLGFF